MSNGNDSNSAESNRDRSMRADQLMGKAIHRTANGRSVYIARRDETWLARGRINGRMFGETLGSNQEEAERRLRQVLHELETDTYQRRSCKRQTRIETRPASPVSFL